MRVLSIIVLLLTAAGSAHSQGRIVRALEKSYELELTDIVLPSSTAGSVIVKPCDDCSSVTHRVTSTTVYLLNTTPVPLGEFLLAAEDRRAARREPTSVGVYVDIDSDRVNRVLLSYGN